MPFRRPVLALLLTLVLAPPAQASGLSWLPWPFARGQVQLGGAPGGAEATQFALMLQDAVASGEWRLVAPFFPDPKAPALAFLKQRWHEMRKGQLDPADWTVRFDPFYFRAGRLGGRLHLAVRDTQGQSESGTFDVELWRRGDTWIVGEELPIGNNDVAVVAHDLQVDLTGPRGHLIATDGVFVEATGPDHRVFLTLAPGLKVLDASFDGNPYGVVQQDDVVFLQAPDLPGPQMVSIRYAGEVPAAATPDAVSLGTDLAWYPRPLGPASAKFRVEAKLPSGFQAVAVGDRQPTTDRQGATFKWLTRAPVAAETLIAGKFDRYEAAWEATAVNVLVRPGRDPEIGKALLGLVVGPLGFYEAHYGPYPFAEPALVEMVPPDQPISSAAAIIPSDALLAYDDAAEAVAFGLARSWTAQVTYQGTADQRRLMGEGVAGYMALLYRAQRDGPIAFRRTLAAAQAIVFAPSIETNEQPNLAAASQPLPAGPTASDRADARALLVLHMLRHQVGNGAFDAGLKALYTEREPLPVDLARFRTAFETHAKTHLDEFFRQWLERKGLPTFTLEDVRVVARAKDRYEISAVVTQSAPAYFVTLPLVVRTTGNPILYNVPVRSLHTPFRLVSRFRPMQILVDPLHDVLAPPVLPLDLIHR